MPPRYHPDADRPWHGGPRLFHHPQQMPLRLTLPATPKRWIEIPGAGHDNVLITTYPIYADVAEWILRHVGQMRTL
jgi:hypothetical protein